jgi:hypothetical protein
MPPESSLGLPCQVESDSSRYPDPDESNPHSPLPSLRSILILFSGRVPSGSATEIKCNNLYMIHPYMYLM